MAEEVVTTAPDPTPKPFDPATIEALRQMDYGKLLMLAPYDDTTGAFLALLKSAKKSILISIYGFTIAEAADTLIAQHQAGLDVRVLFDHTQAAGTAERVQVARLAAAGVPHWIGTSPVAHQILHGKVTIVDGELCETGSWNYSVSAAHQFNTFVIERSPDSAVKLTAFIERLIDWVKAHEAKLQDVVTVEPSPTPGSSTQGATS
jgi:phosphatidylserine/phosphatidylglycerophosphate/cardiolipin synthase-like enzyme